MNIRVPLQALRVPYRQSLRSGGEISLQINAHIKELLNELVEDEDLRYVAITCLSYLLPFFTPSSSPAIG